MISDHTLFILVGPSSCGKSYFAEEFSKWLRKETNSSIKINILSSDSIRSRLLGGVTLPKTHPQMQMVSKQAFGLLEQELKLLMEFPINSNFIILDTSGLSPSFRQNMIDLGKKYYYDTRLIVFKYASKADYYKNPSYMSHDEIKHSVDRLFTGVLPKLGKGYTNAHFVTSLDFNHFFDGLIVNKEMVGLRIKNTLDPNKRYFIIGDIHCCFKEFYGLIQKAGFNVVNGIATQTSKTINCEIILVGDLIDKGDDPTEIINFVHNNLMSKDNIIKLIYGNHERVSYRLLTGETNESAYSDEYYKLFFNSYKIIRDDPELKAKFMYIVDHMAVFLQYESPKYPSFIVTHSPCRFNALGKTNSECLKQQMAYHLDWNKDYVSQVTNLFVTDSLSYPYHVCGHIAITKPYIGKYDKLCPNNLIMIDTGCINGFTLSGVWMGTDKIKTVSVKSSVPSGGAGRSVVDLSNRGLDVAKIKSQYLELAPPDKKRIDFLIRENVCFISGTVSPPPQNKITNKLESIEDGLSYYHHEMARRDYEDYRVVIQPKYMGSRGNMYLSFVDPLRNKLVSRNGYLMSQISPEIKRTLYQQMTERLTPFATKYGVKEIIIDMEVMPWSGLGKGLIDHEFRSVSECLNAELRILRETGFEELELPKKVKILPIKQQQELVDKFTEQVEWFGKSDEIYVKGFSVLRFVLEDDSIVVCGTRDYENLDGLNQSDLFRLVNDDEILVVDLKDLKTATKMGVEFFDKLVTGSKLEGVVIKPLLIPDDFSPMMKVRNPEYLRIIYGWDYLTPDKYSDLMRKKNVYSKIRTSIEEYNLGTRMLCRSDEELNSTEHLHDLMSFLGCELSEQKFDPAL